MNGVSRPAIVSASRRTDIPALFPGEFEAARERGFAAFRHPWTGKPASVSLLRSDVAAYVFWTRNPRPFLRVLARLEREEIPSVFHVTVTGHPRALEPAAPPEDDAVSAVRELARRIGPRRVLWRFDPVLPGEAPEALLRRFDRLSARLAGASSRCTVSLAHPYRKAVRATRGMPEIWEPREGLRDAFPRIVDLGRARGLRVASCCSPRLAAWGVPAGACVDGGLLRELFPGAPIPDGPAPTRPGCLCTASRDIGSYRTCRHGCLYCYAA